MYNIGCSSWLVQQEHLYCSWVLEFLSSKATFNICVFYWQDDISGDYRNVILALVVGGPPPNNASKCKPSPPIWQTYKLSNTVLLLNWNRTTQICHRIWKHGINPYHSFNVSNIWYTLRTYMSNALEFIVVFSW